MDAVESFAALDAIAARIETQPGFYFKIGNDVIALFFESALLLKKMTQAFWHLVVSPVVKPDLVVHIWTPDAQAKKLPSLPWTSIASTYKGYCEHPIYFHFFEYIGALSVVNVAENRAHYVIKEIDHLPWWVFGSPLQVILHVWLRERDLQLTHTAAVGNADAAVLLTGKGGSGKSTTVLSCLQAGFNYIGEDYCVLAPETKTVYSIYQSAKWTRHTRQLFPIFDSFVQNPIEAQTEKALIFYQDFFSQQIRKKLNVRAVISLTVGNDVLPHLSLYDHQSGTKDLMMSTIAQLPFADLHTLQALRKFPVDLPHFRLQLGSDLRENVSLIARVLSEACVS